MVTNYTRDYVFVCNQNVSTDVTISLVIYITFLLIFIFFKSKSQLLWKKFNINIVGDIYLYLFQVCLDTRNFLTWKFESQLMYCWSYIH